MKSIIIKTDQKSLKELMDQVIQTPNHHSYCLSFWAMIMLLFINQEEQIKLLMLYLELIFHLISILILSTSSFDFLNQLLLEKKKQQFFRFTRCMQRISTIQ